MNTILSKSIGETSAVAGNKCTLVKARRILTAGSFPQEINKTGNPAASRKTHTRASDAAGKLEQSLTQKATNT